MSDTENAAESSNRWVELIDMQPRQLGQIALLGAGVGLVMWIVTMLVRQIIIVPIFCGDPANGICVASAGLAGGAATIIAAFVGLLGLVRVGVFRPLLVVLAAGLTLWGLSSWTVSLSWIEALIWSVILYALCYALFTWVARLRQFIPAIIIVALVVILAHVL
jgi:hypothetical protein